MQNNNQDNWQNQSWQQVGDIRSASSAGVIVRIQEDHLLSRTPVGSFLAVFTLDYSGNEIATLAQVESVQGMSNEHAARVKLLRSVDLDAGGKVFPGVQQTPSPKDKVFIAPQQFVELVLQSSSQAASSSAVSFEFASLVGQKNSPLIVTPESILSRHLAVLGATGSGKSNSIARLLEEAAKFDSKVILFDATGEFASLDKGVHHLHLGESPKPRANSTEVSLPYYQLRETDLFAIFNPSGESQGPKLRSAIKSLKLSLLEPQLGLDGLVMKANKTKMQFQAAYQKHYSIVEGQLAQFDITRLPRQILNECVNPNRSATEPLVWGEFNANDQANCVPLVNRIQEAIFSNDLACIFNPVNSNSLLDELTYFMQDKSAQILCISLEHLSFFNHVREIVANATGRHLLNIAREGRFKEQPLLVVVDEAHQFLNEKLIGDSAEYPLDAFALIAKEGRKYGLTICLSTQRPRDIPEDVLSQMGTMLVHRLINQFDRQVVESACGSLDAQSVEKLPVLAPGQALLTGVDFNIPILIQVQRPECEPLSDGPNYQRYWSKNSSLKREEEAEQKVESTLSL